MELRKQYVNQNHVPCKSNILNIEQGKKKKIKYENGLYMYKLERENK